MLYVILTPVVIIMLVLAALHIGFIPPRLRERRTPLDRGMNYSEIQIVSKKNKHLFGWYIPAKTEPGQSAQTRPLVIMVHGWGSNAELMLPVAAVFYQAGINVLLFDARCHGKSDGDTYAALPRFAEDVLAAVDCARHSIEFNGRIILLGHSVGAGAVLYAASLRNDISAVISLAAFANPEQVMRRYFEKFKLPGVITKLLLAYVQWIIGHRFNEIAPLNTITRINVPVLLVHGREDRTIPYRDAEVIYQRNSKTAELLLIDGAGHKLVNRLKSHGQFLIDFVKHNKLL